MKTKLAVGLWVAFGMSAGAIAAPIATHETLDVFGAEFAASGCRGIASDFVAQAIYTSGTVVVSAAERRAVIRKSTDLGVTWRNLYSEALPFNVWHSGARDVAVSAVTGSVFSIQRYEDGARASHWVTIRSRDGGATWARVDDFTYFPAPGENYAYHLAASSEGRLCVAGQVSDHTDWQQVTREAWVLRCSDDDGDSWRTIDEEPGGLARAVAFARMPEEGTEIYAAGSRTLPTGEGYSSVRRWRGGEWREVDAFHSDSGYAGALQLRIDSRGAPWVVGSGWINQAEPPLRRWFVRSRGEQDGPFVTQDRYALSPTAPSEAYDFVEDRDGRMFVVGYAQNDAKANHLVVRRSLDRGATWETALLTAGEGGRFGYGHNAALDPRGKALVCGQVAQPTAAGVRYLWTLYRLP